MNFIKSLSSFAHSFPVYFAVFIFLILLAIVLVISLLKKSFSVRKDAVKRSRSVINGQVAEQFAPFLPNFPCNPSDAHFIGKPVDFIAFPNLSENNKTDEVLLVEVKTGKSELSERERSIKKAVEEGRVRYVVYRMN